MSGEHGAREGDKQVTAAQPSTFLEKRRKLKEEIHHMLIPKIKIIFKCGSIHVVLSISADRSVKIF
jgi:hypothetical protein